MRRLALWLCLLPALAAAATPAGRWEGFVDVPERPLAVVVDLARELGEWTGSVIVPALGIKGAPLAHVVADGNGEVSFDLGGLLAAEPYGPAAFSGRLAA